MMLEEIAKVIGQTAFPIVVALYFIFRMERVLKENTRFMERASTFLDKLNGKLESWGRRE